jgi:SIR2-like domain
VNSKVPGGSAPALRCSAMGHRVVVFAGAGASYGVAPAKYPMTRQFFEQLPEVCRSDVLFSYLTTFLEQRSGKRTLDIEDVLWALGDLVSAIKNATEPGNILQHLLTKNQISAVTNRRPSGPEVVDQFTDLRNRATGLRDAIHDEVYRYYAAKPEKGELEGSWVPLLKWLRGLSTDAIDIVTTNYDLVIESALAEVGDMPIDTGKRSNVDISLDLSLWDRGRPPSSTGLLTKLHGSVDWRYAAEGSGPLTIRWGHPEHDGMYDKRGIIYPGFKGVPEKEPFRSFHDYFGTVSERATHLIFIGFAFRDEYINALLQRAPSPTARIAVIDPSEKLGPLPFLSDAHHVRFPFGTTDPITLLGAGSSIPKWLNALDLWVTQ